MQQARQDGELYKADVRLACFKALHLPRRKRHEFSKLLLGNPSCGAQLYDAKAQPCEDAQRFRARHWSGSENAAAPLNTSPGGALCNTQPSDNISLGH